MFWYELVTAVENLLVYFDIPIINKVLLNIFMYSVNHSCILYEETLMC